MYSIFSDFLSDLLLDAWNAVLDPVQSVITSLMLISLKIERIGEVWEVNSPITRAVIDNVYTFLYGTMCGILALALLWKGWKVYVLWRDGDADVSPQSMILGMGMALAMALAFPYLYDILTDLILYVGNGVTDRLQLGLTPSFDVVSLNDQGTTLLVMFLLFIILMVVLFFKLLSRGVELLFLRLGFPLICLDLINSDASTFKQYTGLFFRQAALSVIQMTGLMLGLFTVASPTLLNVILAVAIELCALSMPKIMSQLLPPSGGGGGGARGISAAYMLRMLVMKG